LEVNRKTNTPSHTLGLPPEDVLVVVRRMSDPACNFNMIYDFLTLSAGIKKREGDYDCSTTGAVISGTTVTLILYVPGSIFGSVQNLTSKKNLPGSMSVFGE